MEHLLKELILIGIALSVWIGPLQAESLSEVIALIKEGHLAKARQITAGWDASSDSHLFVKGVLERRGERAIRHFESLIDRFPQSPYGDQARFRIAQYRYTQGRYREARALLKSIVLHDPGSTFAPQCKRWIAYAYLAEGKADSASLFAESPRETIAQGPPPSPPASPERTSRGPTLPPPPSPQPSETPKPTPSSPSSRPSPTGERYAIQVGAFTQERGALLRKAFFEREGYQVAIRAKTREGTVFYTVWILPFLPAEEARAVGTRIKQKYGIDYVLVAE